MGNIAFWYNSYKNVTETSCDDNVESVVSAQAACSRLEPHPKLSPVINMDAPLY